MDNKLFNNNIRAFNKDNAVKQLFTFIENTRDGGKIIRCLDLIEKIGLKTLFVFEMLENITVSYINRGMPGKYALRVLVKLFPEKI